ncbi:hydantoinase/oxoprolinase family protein [Alphaproteobacteria bacterium]|nr:hydantoinase/oxoprolinase family protein [Rhodospirillaceae bacterium]MBT7732399.1 hydantoinase/oxoprolinase family protein [Rhodospirillaceae bacterium]MDC0998729.1 hydantoinase/oxoprolinase family protein [Alphaproteobacteria bacterium]
MSRFRVGIDIGGTFTDIVFLNSEGRLFTKKVPSSVDNYARAIVEGMAEVFDEASITPKDIRELRHGTTVASNAILELKGARVGLITSAGFRDVLEIRTLRMPRLYDLAWEKPPALVERYLRQVVDERINANGVIERRPQRSEVEQVVRRLLDEKVEAIAICLINAYANPDNERFVEQIVKEMAPDLPLCISADVLPEMKEYERTSTTVINAYVLPVVGTYLTALRKGLDGDGISAPIYLMQSNGGLTTSETASKLPMHIIESGPAGGVIGSQAISKASGLENVITFDMGGTTAKTSMIARGQVTRALDMQVGGGIMHGSRLMTGAGYALKVPAIDLAEVGAGGGSILSIDAGGSLRAGPESAGASPGPVCYDAGGENPTITDANIILGYLNPNHLVGGAVKLNKEKAANVFKEKIAEPLGLSLEEAAYGAHLISASNMIRAIKAVSTERGRNPQNYSLFAFGGNGPLFAAGMADAIGIKQVIVPPSPGLFSSFGLLYADVEHHYSRTFRRLLTAADPEELTVAWEGLAKEAIDELNKEGFAGASAVIERSASLHYKGQIYELSVPAPSGNFDAKKLAELSESFGQEHEIVYGHRAGPEEPVELVNIAVIGRGIPDSSRVPEKLYADEASRPVDSFRKAYFGKIHGWIETPVLARADLQKKISGPAIVEEYDATCLIPPQAEAHIDSFGNIVINL